tara:strand:- start:177 stop:596 length:420 start_codon:yes stop_codon:yes gene_type:complete
MTFTKVKLEEVNNFFKNRLIHHNDKFTAEINFESEFVILLAVKFIYQNKTNKLLNTLEKLNILEKDETIYKIYNDKCQNIFSNILKKLENSKDNIKSKRIRVNEMYDILFNQNSNKHDYLDWVSYDAYIILKKKFEMDI